MKKIIILFIFITIIITPFIINADTNNISINTFSNIMDNGYEFFVSGEEIMVNYEIAPEYFPLLKTKVNIEYEIPNGLDLVGTLPDELTVEYNDENRKYIKGRFELSGNGYNTESIQFNIIFKANKSGIYDLSGDMKYSFNGLNNENIEGTFPPKQVMIEDVISRIEIIKMGLFFNDNIQIHDNPIDLVVDNKYKIGVKFKSENINNRNTIINFPKNIKINFYQLYKHENKEWKLTEEGSIENATLKPNIEQRTDSNTYLLVYDIVGEDIVENYNDEIIFNKNTNEEKSQNNLINFLDWPNTD